RLHEIADMSVLADVAARAQMRIRADDRAGGDAGFVEDAGRADRRTRSDLGVADHRIGANAAIFADARGTQELDERLDDRVGADLDFGIDRDGLRPIDRYAGSHELARVVF